MLQSVLGEAKCKNANCLSPAQRGEFLDFSEASLRTLNMGKPDADGSRKSHINRNIFLRTTLDDGLCAVTAKFCSATSERRQHEAV